jgi:hypothetical protein
MTYDSMNSELKLRLILTSQSHTANEMAKLAGINPTKSWASGEVVHPKAKNVHKQNGCLLEIEDASLAGALKRLQKDLQSQSASLLDLPEDIDIELSCIVYMSGEAPELHLESQHVEFLASMGAAVDIDVYMLE